MSSNKRGNYLLVDITHNDTKVILIEENKITGKSRSPTTVDEPTLDVTVGVQDAIKQIENEKNTKLATENGVKLLCSSSASGGLHMIITGVISNISGESAQRAALGAGALLIDTFSKDDKRPPYKKIAAMRQSKPDILLMSGGTDGGATSQVLEMADVIKRSDIKPRYGKEYSLPLIYAGNVSIQDQVYGVLGENGYALKMVENVRPLINRENLGPARESIYDAYMEHVIIHSPGYQKLAEWTDERIVPSQAMVGKMLYEYAQQQGLNLLAVDIGGDTTDVYSVYNGVFNRSLNAGIGLTYGIGNIVKETGIDNILRWLSSSFEERSVRNIIGNMMIKPHENLTPEERSIQAAIVREAIKLGVTGHKMIAQRLKGVVTERTLGDMFEQALEPTLLNMMKTQLVIGKGDAFKSQTVEDSTLILLDSLQPEGVTELYLDPENMAAPLGNLVSHDRLTALELYADSLEFIGTCIAPRGELKTGQEALRLDFTDAGVSHVFNYGEITVVPLKSTGSVEVQIVPNRLDVGAGRGKPVNRSIRSGKLGLIVDTRGRPMTMYRQTVKLLPFEVFGRDA
ncbi:MAG: glutamate mutase L [Candidatus Bathyarchaeota archaeon]|nr:glutamate mutase L [Candidatus Bathyarchaeota archaeon]